MRNIAKCKLCKSIIESFHPTDYVLCKCGEIAVDGGLSMRCEARNWDNFVRIDERGNEIKVRVEEKEDVKPLDIPRKMTRDELLGELDLMIKNIEALPQQAMSLPINHYDFVSALLLLSALFRSED